MLKKLLLLFFVLFMTGCSIVGDINEMTNDTSPAMHKKEVVTKKMHVKTLEYTELMREKNGHRFIYNSYMCRQDSLNKEASLGVYISKLGKEFEAGMVNVEITGTSVIPETTSFVVFNETLSIFEPDWVLFNDVAKLQGKEWMESKKLRYTFPELGDRVYETINRDLDKLKDMYEGCLSVIEYNLYLKEINQKIDLIEI